MTSCVGGYFDFVTVCSKREGGGQISQNESDIIFEWPLKLIAYRNYNLCKKKVVSKFS